MRAVVQRVKRAAVNVGGSTVGEIDGGLLVYAGVQEGDTREDIDYIAKKVANLRVFEDEDGKMNLDVTSAGAEVLVISQFTLLGDARKGRRPSFSSAEPPDSARRIYEELIAALSAKGLNVQQGEFQAHMEVDSVNDGPITLLLDSRRLF